LPNTYQSVPYSDEVCVLTSVQVNVICHIAHQKALAGDIQTRYENSAGGGNSVGIILPGFFYRRQETGNLSKRTPQVMRHPLLHSRFRSSLKRFDWVVFLGPLRRLLSCLVILSLSSRRKASYPFITRAVLSRFAVAQRCLGSRLFRSLEARAVR
jgi:hypothetical protein